MIDRERLTGGIVPRVIAPTYALGAAGRVVFTLLGLPPGMMLGSLFAVTAVAFGGLRVFGAPPAVPQAWRYVLMPVIGVAIGGSFPAHAGSAGGIRAGRPCAGLLAVSPHRQN